MKVISYARHPDEELARKMNFKYRDFDALLGESDVVTSLAFTPGRQTYYQQG